MLEQMSDEKVYSRGLIALENELGAVETLRFLALVSRQKLDYQQWRADHFARKSLDDIFSEAQSLPR